MKKPVSFLFSLAARLAVAVLLWAPDAAPAQTVTYTVDPRQSSLILSASFGGTYGWGQFTITNQGPGSMVDSFEGTIVATNVPGTGLRFGGGSNIRARLNANSLSPNPNAPSFHPTGSDPSLTWSGTDNYGAVSMLYDQHAIYLAYRDLVLDIPSGGASTEGEPASGMTLGFISGQRAWSQASVLNVGDAQIVGLWPISGGTNQSSGKVTLSADGSVLTIPVVLVTRSYDLLGTIVTFDEIWSGTIVAVAGTPGSTPPLPRLALASAGPGGLQINAGGATASHFNGITTAPWNESSWVGGSASYTFTITNPPSPGAAGFLAYVWLVANPIAYSTEEFSGLANPNVVRMTIESDGHGGATAMLGYRVNAPNDPSSFLGRGFLGGVTNVPFAGTWSIRVNDDTEFNLIAPDGTQAHGLMPRADTAFFSEKVRFYLGVNPNGARNIGHSMTVGDITIMTTRGGQVETLSGNFTTGAPLHKNWTILAANPASIVMMPAHTVYRAEWKDTAGLGPGVNTLEYGELTFGEWEFLIWSPLAATTIPLATGQDILFVPDAVAGFEVGFFRVNVPVIP